MLNPKQYISSLYFENSLFLLNPGGPTEKYVGLFSKLAKLGFISITDGIYRGSMGRERGIYGEKLGGNDTQL